MANPVADAGRRWKARGKSGDHRAHVTVEIGDLLVEVENPPGRELRASLVASTGSRKAIASGRQAARVRMSCIWVRRRSGCRTSSGGNGGALHLLEGRPPEAHGHLPGGSQDSQALPQFRSGP